MTRKKLLSITLFLALLIGTFIYLNKVFASVHYYVNTTEDFKELAGKTNIDVLIYGSSHAYTAFNPLIINDVCKTLSFNLGSDAQNISVTEVILGESLKHTTPKLIIVEIYPPTLVPVSDKKIKGYQLRGLDFVSNFSLLKFEKTKEIYELNEYLGVYFPLLRNHKKWKQHQFFKLSRRENDENLLYSNGYLGSERIIHDTYLKKYENFKVKPQNVYHKENLIPIRAKDNIDNIIKHAKKINAKVLVVSSPDPRARLLSNYQFFYDLETFCSSKNIVFLNLNDYYNEMDLLIDDFKDKSHLNNSGSKKASIFLAKYLNDNYQLPDRSESSFSIEIQKPYEKFKNTFFKFKPLIFSKMVNQSLIKELEIKSITLDKKVRDKLLFDIEFIKEDSFQKLKKYILAVHVYPSIDDRNNLSDRSKSRDLKFEIHDYLLEHQPDSVKIELDSKLIDIDKIEFFLYDESGYKGIIGNKVIVDEIKFTTE